MNITYVLEDRSSEITAEHITILSKLSVSPIEEVSVDLTPVGLRGAQGIAGPIMEWQGLSW